MMQKKLLTNKKIVIAVAILLFLLCVGIILFANSDSQETGGNNSDTEIEQSKEKETPKEDKEKDDSGLEVLKPNEIKAEDSTDVSGLWKDASESNAQTGNTTMREKTDKESKEEDILEDGVLWGEIY